MSKANDDQTVSVDVFGEQREFVVMLCLLLLSWREAGNWVPAVFRGGWIDFLGINGGAFPKHESPRVNHVNQEHLSFNGLDSSLDDFACKRSHMYMHTYTDPWR